MLLRHQNRHNNNDSGPGAPPPLQSVNGKVCPIRSAATNSPGGDGLRWHYNTIIHTTLLFYDPPPPPPIATGRWQRGGVTDVDAHHGRSQMLLGLCYQRSFELAFGNDNAPSSVSHKQGQCNLHSWMQDSPREALSDGRQAAVTLLGSGCRAFPKYVTPPCGSSWDVPTTSISGDRQEARTRIAPATTIRIRWWQSDCSREMTRKFSQLS